MPMGFPAYETRAQHFPARPDHLMGMVFEEVQRAGWTICNHRPGYVEATSSMGLFSFGERIRVTVFQDGGVQVHSEYRYPFAWLDWGHNSGNVTKILGALNFRVHGAQPHV